MRNFFRLLFIVCISLISTASFGQDWSMKKARLMTTFASRIDTSNVLGEYPRPQMVRQNWMNLNGIWQYQPGVSANDVLPVGKLTSKILVPFPVESAISGVMEAHDRLWYRRTFTVPAEWAGQRILIHFGAVDYEAQVYVNGHSLGIHKGGYDEFSYDITSYIEGTGAQELTVRVFDPTDLAGQPRGKQTLNPQGIMYTSTTGIWQTVWLEPTPQTSISNIKMTPDVDQSVLNLKISTKGNATNLTVSVAVKNGETVVATFNGAANSNLVIPISNAKLWSPDSPFLYDLDIKLNSNGSGVDSLKSYFGMRKIAMNKVGAYYKMFFNNEFLFQMGPLDQGFWPDGLYTAPTDAALKYDIEMIKRFGFNMVRKHIKVEPQRWYYWADKLGLMVWQDMPSCNSYWTMDARPDVDKTAYHSELLKMIDTHFNSPSVIMWVVFNEFQGAHDVKAICDEVMAYDTTRLCNQGSGGPYEDAGDILDVHSYPPPGYPNNNGYQSLVCGEFGGIGYKLSGHVYDKGGSYVMVDTPTQIADMYNGFMDQLVHFKSNMGLSAAVYTEITDVENEVNGLLSYDRNSKLGFTRINAANRKAINNNLYMTAVCPAVITATKVWDYTTTQPASNWAQPSFTTTGWTKGQGGFGSAGTPGAILKTTWNTNDIWIRRTFVLGGLSQANLDSLKLYVHHDEECEIYINGVLAATLEGFTSNYNIFDISTAAKNAIVQNGSNVIAVHCHQTAGGQYIDAGLYVLSYNQSSPLAIEENGKLNTYSIYPNPVLTSLNITGFENENVTATVYNAFGAQMMKVSGSLNSINVSDFAKGVYLLKVEGESCSKSFKFAKN